MEEYDKVILSSLLLNSKKAVEAYKEGLKYCPKDDEKTAAILYSNCASCYFNQAAWDMCVECATEAISLNKEYVRPVLSRASAYYELEKFEESYEGKENFNIV